MIQQDLNQALSGAVNQMVEQKGRVTAINPYKPPMIFDPELIDQACGDASNNVMRSFAAPFHDEFRPIAEEIKLNLIKDMESKGGIDEEFLHFMRNTTLPSEVVLDSFLDLIEGEEADGES